MSPKCALNSDTDSPDDWAGKDVDVWYARWKIKVRHWFAFSNRCPRGITCTFVFFPFLYLFPFTVWLTGWSWWYLFPILVLPVAKKWRLMPKTIFAIRGGGTWRYENTDSTKIIPGNTNKPSFLCPDRFVFKGEEFYLSRIQRWCRWSFHIAWPLFVGGHLYFRDKDVPRPDFEHDTDHQLLFAYRGYHRDEDVIFWGDGGFIGTVWK